MVQSKSSGHSYHKIQKQKEMDRVYMKRETNPMDITMDRLHCRVNRIGGKRATEPEPE